MATGAGVKGIETIVVGVVRAYGCADAEMGCPLESVVDGDDSADDVTKFCAGGGWPQPLSQMLSPMWWG